MTVDPNLIFLACQPRSGSTLLQRVLGGHPQVLTLSEPWLMLPPLYALRPDGQRADYDAEEARKAQFSFLESLPEGAQAYDEGLRRMYGYLYGRALEGTGRRYFLDKTPRYYLVLADLHRVFPAARFIILRRNPLAVLNSVLDTWVGEKWLSLYLFRQDLLEAPARLVEAEKVLGGAGLVVRYEALAAAPEPETRRICDFLGLDFHTAMLDYGSAGSDWLKGDHKNVNRHTRPTDAFVQKWQAALADPQFWRLAHDYVHALGDPLLEALGYPGPELRRTLAAARPRLAGMTVSLSWLVDRKPDQRSPLDRRWLRWLRAFHRWI